MPYLMGVNIYIDGWPTWVTVLSMVMLCVTRLAVAVIRSEGPVAHVVADVLRHWLLPRSKP